MPNDLEKQADILAERLAGWERSTLERMGKRIKKIGSMSIADVKTLNNIADVKQDMGVITKELAEITGMNISDVQKMYAQSIEEQHLNNEPLYDYRGKKFVPFSQNTELKSLVKAYAETTGKEMINLSKIGAQNLGIVKTLDNGDKVFEPLKKFYTDALDKAVLQVTSGATDFHTAMRDVIRDMGGSGISVNYGSGKHRRLDTAVRQSILWGAKQASVEYNESIASELGCDGYEIDYHSNPRPTHVFMQGRQFCIGDSKTINGKKFDGMEDTRDAKSGKNVTKSLLDYGCLHFKTPIICGVSEPTYSAEELKRLKERDNRTFQIGEKQVTGYEASQMMRRLETAVRGEKSIRDLARTNGDTLQVRKSNAKIKAYKVKYNEISNITGISPDTKRMSVPRM